MSETPNPTEALIAGASKLAEAMSFAFSVSAGKACVMCGELFTPAELDDTDAVYREVSSWVHGPKLQSPVLREQTGRLAHASCITKMIEGQAPDQQSIPGLES